jgi:hypothetical protein
MKIRYSWKTVLKSVKEHNNKITVVKTVKQYS